jgi:aerobic-type carbon monoxide dehydrogenase small subunit (CoxS/CutS family)
MSASGTKFGCGVALCGACTVHLDGMPVRSCVTPIGAIGDKAITTIEAVGQTPIGKALQEAWLELDVVQCGYCQSGQIMSAAALIANNPHPSDAITPCLATCADAAPISVSGPQFTEPPRKAMRQCTREIACPISHRHSPSIAATS